MLYYLFRWLDQYDFPGAGMFAYTSFRALVAVILALLISTIWGDRFINLLKRKQITETQRDASIDPFGVKKVGVPSMGGVIIIFATLIPCLLLGRLGNIYMILMLITIVWLGSLGFADDYIKIFKRDKEGLHGKFKIIGQVGLGLIVGLTLYLSPQVVIRENIEVERPNGQIEVVHAAKEIKAAYPQTEFRLLGNVDESYPNFVPASVVRNDDEVGYINYLGFKSDVTTSLYEADCIVHPSFYNEGLSRVLMEALAMQKPIITTDIPGCRETVDPDRNGYIVKAHSVESLADGIRKFLALSEDERKQMGIYGRRKAEKEFDVKNVIAVYKKITDRLQTNQDNHHE